MKTKVLFVAEKWCDATPNLGLSNSFHNFFNTFSQTQDDCIMNILHIDECTVVYKASIDKVLLEYCQQFPTNIIFFSFLGGQTNMNPSVECCRTLRSMGIYLCFLWHDSNPADVTARQSLREVANLHVIYDHAHSPFHNSLEHYSNEIRLFAPQDSSLYYPDAQVIPVSFIGSLRDPQRARFLAAAKQHLPELFITGGERETGLTPTQYAKYIRTSKIGINYSYHPCGYYQIKGRVFEILASKSLLMESENPSTKSLLTPGVDYVEYNDSLDLAQKVRYYLEHESERLEICYQGYKIYQQYYTGKHFWDKVIERIKKGRTS